MTSLLLVLAASAVAQQIQAAPGYYSELVYPGSTANTSAVPGSMAIDNNGAICVAAVEKNASQPQRITYGCQDPLTGDWPQPYTVYESRGQLMFPSVAIGNLGSWVTWSEYAAPVEGGSTVTRVHLAHKTAYGWTRTVINRNLPAGSTVCAPVVTVDVTPTGAPVIAWNGGQSIILMRPSGNLLRVTRYETPAYYTGWVRIAVDDLAGESVVHLAWSSVQLDGWPGPVHYVQCNSTECGGLTPIGDLGSPNLLGVGYVPSIAVDLDHRPALAWMEYSHQPFWLRPYFARWDGSDFTGLAGGAYDEISAYTGMSVDLEFDGANPVVLWGDARNAGQLDLFLARGQGGIWSSPDVVDDAPTRQSGFADLGFGPTGPEVIYTDHLSSSQEQLMHAFQIQ